MTRCIYSKSFVIGAGDFSPRSSKKIIGAVRKCRY